MHWYFSGQPVTLPIKMIFPALQRLAKRGELNMPVIGGAKSGWTLEQLKQRAQDSVDRFRGVVLNSFNTFLTTRSRIAAQEVFWT